MGLWKVERVLEAIISFLEILSPTGVGSDFIVAVDGGDAARASAGQHF